MWKQAQWLTMKQVELDASGDDVKGNGGEKEVKEQKESEAKTRVSTWDASTTSLSCVSLSTARR